MAPALAVRRRTRAAERGESNSLAPEEPQTNAMAALSASFARLSVSAPKGKAAAPARLAARSSTAFAAGAVALRKAQPVVKAVRLATVAPVEARHMPGKNGLKTRKAAAKRYKVTAGGKVSFGHVIVRDPETTFTSNSHSGRRREDCPCPANRHAAGLRDGEAPIERAVQCQIHNGVDNE